MNWIVFVSLVMLAIEACPLAIGQSYNYSYGNSRVVVESLNGRSNPSSTYIGTGTMSKSAQGIIQYGAQVNPGLPKVNRGNYIGTPGDNLYTMTPILSQEQKPVNVQRASKVIYRSQPKKPLDTYVPDPNVPLTYANFQTESSMQTGKNIVNTTGNAPSTTSKQISP